MLKRKISKRMKVIKILKRELASRNKYRTTYKDIKKYFTIINKVIFKNILSPFNEVKIKKLEMADLTVNTVMDKLQFILGKEKVQLNII